MGNPNETTVSGFADFYSQQRHHAIQLAWLLTHDASATEDVVHPDGGVGLRPTRPAPQALTMCVDQLGVRVSQSLLTEPPERFPTLRTRVRVRSPLDMGFHTDDGSYVVTADEVAAFRRDGYVHLPGLLTEAEVAELEHVYDRFLRREIEVPGKDYCDMAGDYGRDPSDFSIINVMLPRRYYPQWQGNILERRALQVAAQLHGDGMEIDYDQLLAKQPFKADAVFAWHQDMAYWPDTPDTRTATVWCAIDDSTPENGCMRFVPATNHETALRPHQAVFGGRGESHALGTELRDGDAVVAVPIRRGDCTVHNERVLHGSGGNTTAGFRRAYIIACRSIDTIATERLLGFTHSHNDEAAVLDEVGIAGQTRS